jgi:hypothetical protein
MSTFTSPFTGTVVQPTDVSYLSLAPDADVVLRWPQVVNPEQVPAARIIDVSATVANLEIRLPDASQGAVGTDILFRNLGAYDFTVSDATGLASILIETTKARYFYLTDNTSVAGTWGSVEFGAGTAVADAAALAGNGLLALDGLLQTAQNIVNVSTTPVINENSRASTFVWTSGIGTFTLPQTVSISTGWYIGFRNAGTGSLTITPTAPNLINGVPSITTNPGDSGFIFYDDNTAGYVTVGWQNAANIIFTAATYDVDSIILNTLSLVSYAPIIQTYVAQSGTRTVDLDVTLPPITQLYILVNETNQSSYNITFQVQGSAQVPISLATGDIITVLSDGTSLFILTSATTNTFQANDGNAGAPAYTFVNDLHTGMYLVGTSILGLSANSTNVLSIDNTNTSFPLLTTPARIVAGSIAGGQF